MTLPRALLSLVVVALLARLAAADDGLARPSPTWFVLLASQRTGSTLLAALLNEHPHVHCMQEVFVPGAYNVTPGLLPHAYSSWPLHERVLNDAMHGRLVYTAPTTTTRVVEPGKALDGDGARARGFKHMYNHLLPPIRPQFVAWAGANHVHVVHLHRNPIESFVSVRVAEATGVWHSVDAGLPGTRSGGALLGPNRAVHVNVTNLVRSVTKLAGEFAYFRTQLAAAGTPYTAVDYSQLSTPEARAATLATLWPFLGVVPPAHTVTEPAAVPLRRLSRLRCADRVANWAEARRALIDAFPGYVSNCETGAFFVPLG
jgi:LPS sulfotransferase NodH